MAWPLTASSAWALSVPVVRHCRRKRGRARVAKMRVATTDRGTVTKATSANRGETVSIITVTPTRVNTAVRHLVDGLLEALGEVVDVVGHPAEQVASGVLVDVGEGKAVELGLDGLSQSEHRSLERPAEQVVLDVAQRPRQREHPADDKKPIPEPVGVDAALADAGHDDVGGAAEEPGADHGQAHAHRGQHHHQDQNRLSRPVICASWRTVPRKLRLVSTGSGALMRPEKRSASRP